MEKTVRPWDPNAPSLLWAHEIRRENIHLVNQLEDLRQQTNELRAQSQTTNTACDAFHSRLKEIEDKIEVMLESMSKRVESLAEQHVELKAKMDAMEERSKSQTGDSSRLKESIQMRVLDEVRDWLAREKGMGRGRWGDRCSENDAGFKQASPEPDIVPDSMHMDESASRLPRKDSLRSLTATTWGSSSQSQPSSDQSIRYATQRIAGLNSAQHPQIKQDGRGLGEYLSYVDGVRAQLPPRKREGQIVEAFVQGLDDPGTRCFMEGQMDRTGWSWDALAKIVREIEKQRAQALELQRQVKAESIGHGGTVQAAADSQALRQRKKQRRFIPIVPADEDDLL